MHVSGTSGNLIRKAYSRQEVKCECDAGRGGDSRLGGVIALYVACGSSCWRCLHYAAVPVARWRASALIFLAAPRGMAAFKGTHGTPEIHCPSHIPAHMRHLKYTALPTSLHTWDT